MSTLSPSRSRFELDYYTSDTSLTERQVLTQMLAAIKRRKGLIHDAMIDGHTRKVCAIGALLQSIPGQQFRCDRRVLQAIQNANDSVPDFTPAQRRSFMVGWIKQRLADMGRP